MSIREMALDRMAGAFNEWMRRYIESPEQFEREFRSVTDFLAANAKCEQPTYGVSAAAYLTTLLDELPTPAPLTP